MAVIIDAVNHFGIEHGHEVLDLVLPGRPSWVVGFSTGGLERVPFRQWAPVFDRARKAGLRLAAHAGENGPGTNVRDAILDAGVERIVHGVRAAAVPDIVALLAGAAHTRWTSASPPTGRWCRTWGTIPCPGCSGRGCAAPWAPTIPA